MDQRPPNTALWQGSCSTQIEKEQVKTDLTSQCNASFIFKHVEYLKKDVSETLLENLAFFLSTISFQSNSKQI
jgi:hypothetical protein